MKIDQIGTLEELGVKPGDVVEWVGNNQVYTVDAHGVPRNNSGGWVDAETFGPYRFRLVSRATPPVDLTKLTAPFGLGYHYRQAIVYRVKVDG